MSLGTFLKFLTAFVLGAVILSGRANDAISSFAFVREDGALQIDGRLVYLYGIYIPPTDKSCNTSLRPVRCNSRAALALEFKISGDFVRCMPRFVNADGSLIASCTSGEDDLSEWMLQKGWAIARPDAPFSYEALEKIARARGFGIWGIPVEINRKRIR
ncbi:nuclease-like protein [Janthinobacterium sp. 17J80-10]|uniref:thermonuclease family protein n=1 Tax=Janthinobacterium sp. 17J80-10 TaxID=2497863 RepID=UPI00100543A4|nr:nuclease-like protein [Janthinobacterium sp. 17J80-10]QAU34981.1 nuclease-like protein [Janthinobacterium sp. 17J80-10]